MTNSQHTSDQKESTVISIIQSIKDGTRNPKNLSEVERQECAEFLSGEGYAQAQIGQILMITDRTVRRDLKIIEERNALSPDINLARRIIGNMFYKAMAHHKYLMRLARSSEASISEKGQSEFLAWRVLKEMTEKMQYLGYLPLRPQEITGDFFHHLDDQGLEKSYEDARKSLNEVIDVAKQCGNLTPELEKNVNSLQKKIKKAEIVYESEKLLKEQTNENKEDKQDDK